MFKITHPAIINDEFDYDQPEVVVEFFNQDEAIKYEWETLSLPIAKINQTNSDGKNVSKANVFKGINKSTQDNSSEPTIKYYSQADFKGAEKSLAITNLNLYAREDFDTPATINSFDASWFVIAVVISDGEGNWEAYYFDKKKLKNRWENKVKSLFICGASISTILAVIKIFK